MHYYVVGRARYSIKHVASSFPCVVLFDDNWDDYTYKTLFVATFHASIESSPVEIGPVKILDRRLEGGNSRTLLGSHFELLDENYTSLGQELDYYRNLLSLGSEIYNQIFENLRDCAIDSEIESAFRDLRGFQISLLRTSEANKCLSEAKSIISGHKEELDIAFSFEVKLPGCDDESHFDFDFSFSSVLPSAINVIIGRNGCGKTQLLNHLARAITDSGKTGKFSPARPNISRVVSISYSAFDQFYRPNDLDDKKLSYRYCGLLDKAGRIRDVNGMISDIEISLSEIIGTEREILLREVLSSVLHEQQQEDFWSNQGTRKDVYGKMSAGQKIVTTILAKAAEFIENNSLLLLDEPETHLHPGLLWSFMIAIERLLKETQSFAVMSTHSPIILQQIPAKYVKVIRRKSAKCWVESLPLESFGENIQKLMETVFDFAEPEHDYRDVLRELNKEYSNTQIESFFENRLSFQAKLYLKAL